MNRACNISFYPVYCLIYIYYKSKANLSSQDFNLACRYFDGIIPTFLPLLICFSPVAKFLTKTKAAQSDSEANYTGSYPSPGAIFTTLFAKVFGPYTLCMTVGKGT